MKKLALLAVCLLSLTTAGTAQAQVRRYQLPSGPGIGPAPYNPYGMGQTVVPGGMVNPYYPYRYPYSYSNPGIYPVPYGSGYPVIGLPTPIGGGYFNMNVGNFRFNMWQAPSGYYYPWLTRPTGFNYAAPIVIVERGQSTPTASQPPLRTVFSDMNKFLDDAKEKGKVSDADYRHLKLRASDLQKKEQSLRIAAGGTMDQTNEDDLRKEVDKLGEEVSYRVKQ